MCANAYDVELTLETVPPEGTAIAGLDFLVLARLAAGSASAQFGFTVTASLQAGAATAGVTMLGLDGSVAVALAAGTATVGSGGDPNFANVSLLLHMDGSNGSTTFADSSSAARTITVTGNTQISTAQSKFGGASALFDGNNDFIRATASTDLQFPGDFTIELWTYPLGTGDYIIGSSGTDPNTQVFRLNEGGSGRLSFFLNGIQVFSATAAGIAANTWQHLAISRSGSSTRMFVNGTQIGSTNTSWIGTFRMDVVGTFFFNGSRYNLPPSDFHGYIDDLRITKGVARYTANFTPPTEPFPDS